MDDILDKIGEYMNKKVKYGIAGACLMLIIFIVYMICTYNPDRYYKSYEEENYAIAMEIIRCFDERDSAALEKMFSNNVRSHNSVRAQIQSAFAIYNSKSSSCEDFFDQGGHVVVGVFGKAAAESDVGLAVGEVVVAGIDGGVAHVVDGVERFHAFAVFEGIFFDDDGLGSVGTFFVEVFVLADADVVVLGGVVGDDAAGLCPGFVDDFGLETYRAVVEASETVVEVFVDFAGEDGVAGYVLIGVALFEVVDAETDLGAFEELVDQIVVAADGDAGIGVFKVVVVVGEAQGYSFYQERWQHRARASPLLFVVTFDEQVVYVGANHGDCLVFEVERVLWRAAALAVDDGFGFFGCLCAPQSFECVHIEGQVTQFAVYVESHGLVDIGLHLDE